MKDYNPSNNIKYNRFSCKIMDFDYAYNLPSKELTIVEGSYSMRKDFREIYDYKIFLYCDYEVQLERIEKRNGSEMLQNFINLWIPMENKYFEEEKIKDICDTSINCNEYICKNE